MLILNKKESYIKLNVNKKDYNVFFANVIIEYYCFRNIKNDGIKITEKVLKNQHPKFLFMLNSKENELEKKIYKKEEINIEYIEYIPIYK